MTDVFCVKAFSWAFVFFRPAFIATLETRAWPG
jgi:hypothetical protein